MLPASHKGTALEGGSTFMCEPGLPGEFIAARWGHLASATKKQGITLAVVDGIIAATALEHALTLVTRNTKDYGNLGISLLSPWDLP